MPDSVIFTGLTNKQADPDFSEICRQMTSLCNIAQIANSILLRVMPALSEEDVAKIQQYETVEVGITDPGIIGILKKLPESGQRSLEDMLIDMGIQFGLNLDLIKAESIDCQDERQHSQGSFCYLLEITRLRPHDDLPPDGLPDGDDDVEPHADIEEDEPVAMAMAAGAR